LTQTVLEGTSTSLTSSANPSAVGQGVTFTATVSIAGGGGVTPDGSVTFMDGTTVLSTQTLSASGVAQYYSTALTAGVHSITAAYSGDAAKQIEASTSAALNQDVEAPTTGTLTSSLNPSNYGMPVTFTATIAPAGANAPTGTVTFLDGTAPIGTGTLNGNPGVAAFTTSALGVGVHTITATYPGDSYNGPSTSNPVSQVVNVAQTSTSVTAAPSPGIAGGQETIIAAVKVTVGAGTPTGTVTFSSGATQLGSAPLNNGTATITPALAQGPYQIVATYSGDSNDQGSASSALPLTIAQAVTQTALTISPNPALVLQPITFTAKVTGNGGTPTGSVNFIANGNIIGAGSVNASGTASFTTSALAAGAYSVTAAYTGDANDGSSTSAATSLTVALATTATAITVAPNPALVGTAIVITAKVTGNGGIPTGTVNFIANGNTLASATLADGSVSFTISTLAPGTYAITASYLGDAADSPSSSASVSEVVSLIPTTTSLGSTVTAGTNPQVILVATVLSNGSSIAPTGAVSFVSGTTTLGSGSLDSNGVATLTPNLASGVNYSIVANYSGDTDHSPSSSPAVQISGTPAPFSLGVSPSSVTMATSQNATVIVSLTSNGNFTDTIGLGCASLPAGITCHFSNPSVKLTAGGSASVQLNIDTNNPLSGGSAAMNARPGSARFSLAGLFLPLSLGFGLVFWRARRRSARFLGIVTALVLTAAMLLFTGCSSFTVNTAAPGNYVIQVTGTGASTNVQEYQNVSLDITK